MKTKSITAIGFLALVISLTLLSAFFFGSCASQRSSTGCHLTQHYSGY